MNKVSTFAIYTYSGLDKRDETYQVPTLTLTHKHNGTVCTGMPFTLTVIMENSLQTTTRH